MGYNRDLRPNFIWGAKAYLIHRRGMALLLDRYWPGGRFGLPFEELEPGTLFRLETLKVVGSAIFSAPRGTFLAVWEYVAFATRY